MEHKARSDFEKSYFSEKSENNIVYVVNRSFSTGLGFEYFKSFEGKPNYLKRKTEAGAFTKRIISWIGKKIPHVKNLIEGVYLKPGSKDVSEIINSLSKLFSVNEHQAVGPEVIDPIIIQEGEIGGQEVAEIVSLHKDSFLRPTIIIILQDNDFERAKNVLRLCPHATTVKFIENSGQAVIWKIINTGAENINEFLNVYSRQCFNACSRTERNVIFNPEWAENSQIKLWSPSILRLRSLLLYDNKQAALQDINHMMNKMPHYSNMRNKDRKLILSFEAISKIFRTYSLDYGGKDILDAQSIAHELNNEILKAHVFRYARYIPDVTRREEREMTAAAESIFSNNQMEDYAIYCKNNNLVTDFYEEKISTFKFESMFERMTNNVPGLIGMPIIANNAGVSFLYQNKFEKALEYFKKGLSNNSDRMTQQVGIRANILITKHLAGETISDVEIRNTINLILIHLGSKDGAFLSAPYIVNLLAIAIKRKGLFAELINNIPLQEMINNALPKNKLGSSSLAFQLHRLQSLHQEFKIPVALPRQIQQPSGIRGRFLTLTGINPAIYNAWL